MQEAKYLAVNVFDEGVTPEEQQKIQPVNPSDSTNTQNDTKANPPTTEQDTSKQTQSNTTADGSVQQNNMPAYIPWIGAGVVAIVILIALMVIIRKLNKK